MKQYAGMGIIFLLSAAATAGGLAEHNRYLNGTIFEDVTAGSGFEHQGHGKGLAMGDFDMNGRLDVFVSVVYARNKFFQNEGDFRFKDMAPTLRLDCPHDAHGAVLADFNNNGYLDIFVVNNVEDLSRRRGNIRQPNRFYVAHDEGYVESAQRAGIAGYEFNYSCGVTTADVNGNGFLDIFVARGGYRKGAYCRNALYINNGNGTFTDIAGAAGVDDPGNGYCCAFGDYNNNGLPDLYVGNINDTDQPVTRILYRNNGDGTFTDVTREAGLEGRGNNISAVWADFNNNGYLDLYLGNSAGPGHPEEIWMYDSLFMNNGDGTFTDVSEEAGVALPVNTRGVTTGDINNNGYLDVIVNTSADFTVILLNDGRGRFTNVSQTAGGSVYYGHGLALGDLEGDGDLDLVSGNWRRPSFRNAGKWKVFRNRTDNNNFLKLDVEGTISNRSAVMTRIWVYDAGHLHDKRHLRGFRQITAGNGTFPGNPLQVHFGLDAAERYDLALAFPSGVEVLLEDVAAGQTLKIVEPENE